MGDEEKAAQHISSAVKAHEMFYLHFKQHYPNEGYLIKHFGKEYYLDRARHLMYINDSLEKKMAETTSVSCRTGASRFRTLCGRIRCGIPRRIRLVHRPSSGAPPSSPPPNPANPKQRQSTRVHT